MVTDRVCALCEIPSVSRHEGEIGKRAAQIMRHDGLDVEEQEVAPQRNNIIARLRTGRAGPTLLFNGHLDTLPPPTSGWTRDPYRPQIENGRLYAAEINNMKGAVGAMMAALATLVKRRDELSGEIILSAVVGECDSLGFGTVSALERGLKADSCINGEPTNLAVMTSHSGVTQLELVIRGRSAHVSQRAQGIDAIAKLVALLPSITEQALSFTRHPDFPGLPTVHVGRLEGGILPSMLAEEARAGIDVRTVPGMTAQSVLADLEQLIARAKASDPDLDASLTLSPRPKFMQPPPFHVDKQATIVTAVAAAHRQVAGSTARVGTLIPQVFFGSDASHLLAAGIPTAIYGPGEVTDISTPDESMALEHMLTAANVYLSSARAICARVDHP
jgi:acetylornithine deacetylase